MNNVEKQISEAEQFMIEEMKCGNSLPKLENWEKRFAAWKLVNGFHIADDCEAVLDELHAKL